LARLNPSSRNRPSRWLAEKPIGQGLREAYQVVENEPVPERLKTLIEELKSKERSKNR
jgi:hypothetical protein